MSDETGIDLHTHSHCSDGSLAPGELVERAAAAGVRMLALTDHDTLAGLAQASAAAERVGIRLVPGVEISASWRHQSIHVLGLWIDPASSVLAVALDAQAERRRVRMRRMCAALGKLRLPGDELLAAVEAYPGIPTRSHLAAALLEQGHVRRIQDAFRKYLGRGQARARHSRLARPRGGRRLGARGGRRGMPRTSGPLSIVLGRAQTPRSRFRDGGRHSARGGIRRQRRAECRGLRGARARIRAAGLGWLGLSWPTTRLESFGAVG